MVQLHCDRDPSSSVRREATKAENGVAHSATFSAETLGTEVTSACIAWPYRSATMVLTHGMPSVSVTALRTSSTLVARAIRTQVPSARWLALFASRIAKAVSLVQASPTCGIATIGP